MADQDNSTNTTPVKIGTGKPEVSMEKRLLLAFGLMGLVLLGSQMLFPPAEPVKPPAAVEQAAEGEAAPAQAQAETPGAAPAAEQGRRRANARGPGGRRTFRAGREDVHH
jgi:hypothetical protein